jgi:hypothetical protein
VDVAMGTADRLDHSSSGRCHLRPTIRSTGF